MNAANFAFHALQAAPVSTFDARLADQWRHAHSTLDEALRCIRQYRRVVEERNARLSTGALVHSPKYIAYAEGIIAFYVKRYRKALRVVTEAEIEMEGIGMKFARSSDDWREDAELVGRA